MKKVLIQTLLVLTIASRAFAGSINGNLIAPENFSCDNRVTEYRQANWCTDVNAQIIKNRCVIVVHLNQPIENCGWQGCGRVSFINERPKIVGTNVVEYGMTTPLGGISISPEWEMNQSSVMPKAPFPRHYLRVSQFIEQRQKCAGLSSTALATETARGTPLGRICAIQQNILLANPYYFCMHIRGALRAP